MIGFLRVIRALLGVLSLLMFIASYGFINNLGGALAVLNKFHLFVETGLIYTFISYILIGIISIFGFIGLTSLIKKLYFKKHGKIHSSLSKNKWSI